MAKENPTEKVSDTSSPFILLIKEMKGEIMNEVKLSEASMKEELRYSLEQTYAKMTTLTNTVKENASKINAIEEWISNTECSKFNKTLYSEALKTPSKPNLNDTKSPSRKSDDINYNNVKDIFSRVWHILDLETIGDEEISDNYTYTGDKEQAELKAIKLAVKDFLNKEMNCMEW